MSQPTIRIKSSGAAVRQLQALLGAATDGDFGPRTDAALRAAQTAHGLVADGVCGPKTWAALGWVSTAEQVGPTPYRYHLGRSPNLIRSVEGIVLHYTATPYKRDDPAGADHSRIRRWLSRPSRKSSTHFVVMRDGTTYQAAALYERTWHAPHKTRGKPNNTLPIGGREFSPNMHTIAVDLELAGWLKDTPEGLVDAYKGQWWGPEPFRDHRGRPWEALPQAQRHALFSLLTALGRRFPHLAAEPFERLVGHADINVKGTRVDPGPALDMKMARDALAMGKVNR